MLLSAIQFCLIYYNETEPYCVTEMLVIKLKLKLNNNTINIIKAML